MDVGNPGPGLWRAQQCMIEMWHQKRPRHMDVGNPGPGLWRAQQCMIKIWHKKRRHMVLKINVLPWDRHKTVAGLKRLMGSQHPLYI
jgi:hypothetical protein